MRGEGKREQVARLSGTPVRPQPVRGRCFYRGWAGPILLLLLCLTASLPLLSQPELLTVASYNIHHARGTDDLLSIERVAEVLREADIAGLQEVDNRFGDRSEFQPQAEQLAGRLNRYFVFAANLDLDGSSLSGEAIVNARRQYGTALLSRYPIEFARNYPLPMWARKNGTEQRGLLEAQLSVRGRSLRVYVTHLSHNSAGERIAQVAEIRRLLERAAAAAGPQGEPLARPVILLGDFNFRPESEEYALLTAGNLVVDAWAAVGRGEGATIGLKSGRPARIDYVFVSPDLAPGLDSAHVDTETPASDHQPLFVRIRLPE